MGEGLLNFSKNDTFVAKGVAIILLCTYHLFQYEDLFIQYNISFYPLTTQQGIYLAGFGNICVAMFVFLTAYGITRTFQLKDESWSLDAPQLAVEAVKRYIYLVANFFVMYISVNILFFNKINYMEVYGQGKSGICYILVDSIGMAELMDTPTLNMTWWYMELAVILVIFVPLLYMMVREWGRFLIVLGFFLPFVIVMDEDVQRYFLTACIGVCTAYYHWFERLKGFVIKAKVIGIETVSAEGVKLPKWIKGLAMIGLLALSVTVRQNYVVYNKYAHIADGIIAFIIIYACYEFLSDVKVLSKGLEFLGKNSMNIFYVHTLFYYYYYKDLIYSFKYALLIEIVLIGIGLIYSVLIEFIKNKLGFYNCVVKIQKHVVLKAEIEEP